VAGKVGAKARVIIGQALTGERPALVAAFLPYVLRGHLIASVSVAKTYLHRRSGFFP